MNKQVRTRRFGLVDPAWESGVPLSSWGGALSPVFWFVIFVAAIISLVIPESVVRESVEAQDFSQFVRGLLLSVSRYADIAAHANSTNFPHVALLSHAWLWTGMLVLPVFNAFAVIVNIKNWVEWVDFHRPPARRLSRWDRISGAAIVLSMAPVFTMIPGGRDASADIDNASRLFFSLLTCSVIFTWHVMTYALMMAASVAASKRMRM